MSYSQSSHLGNTWVISQPVGNLSQIHSWHPPVQNLFNIGLHTPTSIDSPTHVPSHTNNINSDQSSSNANTPSTLMGGNTISSSVLTTPTYHSLRPHMSSQLLEELERLRRLRQPNLGGTPSTTLRRFGDTNNVISIFAPTQGATRSQISAHIPSVSVNYQGDPYIRANQSANIPDSLNTSVWITNLPPDLDHKMLLDHVRDCGKVYATVVNGPGHNHFTAASKLVFFDVAGAQNLLRQFRDGRFSFKGYMPRVCYNRIRTEARPLSTASRVLHIEGPSCIVNQAGLAQLFRDDGIVWQDEAVIVLSRDVSYTQLEWRFGSYRCQAESARCAIDRRKKHHPLNSWLYQLWQRVIVYFGVDPCAPLPVMPQTHRVVLIDYGLDRKNTVSSTVFSCFDLGFSDSFPIREVSIISARLTVNDTLDR
ncbi:hypothetical protein F5Y03DRAFT_404181 [Xylaria venustula]|nr:hypothetical protein F5Y03DRAFT_404181 [Xylaria venustula]